MIKMCNAYTLEVDDVEKAVDEILGQLDLDSLMKNSACILTCHSDFIESGIVDELGKRLPFDMIGCTTIGSSTCGSFEPYQLSLTVLTSNDVMFSTAETAPIYPDNYEQCVADAFRDARAKLPGPPELIVVLVPLVTDISAADFLKFFDKICGNKPIFGAVASDTSITYENACTIRNGKDSKRAVQMLLFHGNVKPEFIATSLPARSIRQQKAVITESQGSVIKKVNDMPVSDYFSSVGIVRNATTTSAEMPLLMDYEDACDPVALSVYGVTEDGAICTGEVPQGITFSIGGIDRGGILETTKTTVDRILSRGKIDGVLLFPCIVRYLMLSPDYSEEVDIIKDGFHNKTPYFMFYAGAEICPSYSGDGKVHNRMHSYSMIACVLQEPATE